MGRKGTDAELRDRLRAWVRWAVERYSDRWPSVSALARHVGTSGPGLSQIIAGKRTAGLDIIVKLHRKLGLDVNEMIDLDPPAVRRAGDTSGPFAANRSHTAHYLGGPPRRAKKASSQ